MEQILLDIDQDQVKEEAQEPKKAPKKKATTKGTDDKKKAQEEAKAKAKEEKEKAQEEKAKARLIIDELREKLVNEISTKNKDLKENISIRPTSKYVGVRYKGKVVAELEQVGRGLIVRVLDIYGEEFPSLDHEYNIKEGENDLLIKKCPNRFGWRTNCEHLLTNKKQYKQCLNALVMSVNVIKKELEDKAKAKEKAKEEKKKEETK